jgi:hypothetical protein
MPTLRKLLMRFRLQAPIAILWACLNCASASVLYVSQSSTNATPPYTDWTTAATNIQDAIDAASANDTVLVTNGVYENGGCIVYGAMSNRVAVTKPLTLQSVNGPAVTLIEGYQIPNWIPCGDSAVRCVYLTNGAVLAGFTLTNGATRFLGDTNREDSGAGVWCESTSCLVSNCIVVSNATALFGGGAMRGTLVNCVLQSNRWAFTLYAGSELFYGYGGGAAYSSLTSCTVASSSGALLGGGVFNCTLTACTLSNNSAGNWGGGAYNSTLVGCILNSNSASSWGGGVSFCTLSNCLLTGNYAGSGTTQEFASGGGGGADSSTLNNCTLSGNVGATAGGGASASFLTNCVLTNNSALFGNGGGASGGTLSNCLILANSASINGEGSGGGTYNSTVINSTLTGNSCGSGGYNSGGGAYGGTLNNCTVVSNTANFGGGASGGAIVDSCSFTGNMASYGGGVSGAFANNCTLTANRASYGGGAAWACNWGGCDEVTILNDCTLIDNWAGSQGGGASGCPLNNCVLIGNWQMTYNYGGFGGGGAYGCWLTNCLLLTNSTIAGGGGAFYSTLVNCVLVGNSGHSGGGAEVSTLYNCSLMGNQSGASGCTLNNCTLTGNSSEWTPVVDGSTLNDSIIYFSSASNYSDSCVLNYCCTTPLPSTGVGNTTNDPGLVDWVNGNLRLQPSSPCINAGYNGYVTTPIDLDGNPRIVGGTVDMGAYEYQNPTSVISYAWLQQYGLATDGSADFIDSDGDGMNNWQEWVAGTDPLDPLSVLKMQLLSKTLPGALLTWNSDAAHTYFIQRGSSPANLLNAVPISTNVPGLIGATTFLDSDAPRLSAAFYRIGTSTTTAPTPIVVQPPEFIPASVLVTWTSVTNRSYLLQRSTNLSRPAAFLTLQSNLIGQAGTTSFMDTNAVAAGPYFYRVVVQR